MEPRRASHLILLLILTVTLVNFGIVPRTEKELGIEGATATDKGWKAIRSRHPEEAGRDEHYFQGQTVNWKDSKILPQWMKDYFYWHRSTLQTLDGSNWKEYHYLLYRCVEADKKCSGTSDRLKAIPDLLLLAHNSRRLLFLYWNRPARLEEFLVPPYEAGLNWTVPDWLAGKLNVTQRGPKYFFESPRDFERFPRYQDVVARVKNVRSSGYFDTYNRKEQRNQTAMSFEAIYHDVWQALFAPSPTIARLVQAEQDALHLIPGQYVAAHVRTRYMSDSTQAHEEENALLCARKLIFHANTHFSTEEGNHDTWPIFIAADSTQTTRAAVAYGERLGWPVVTRRADKDPLHLDRGRDFLQKSNDWKDRPASDFYDIFVDLFLLAGSRCISYGIGGFGKWAGLLAGTMDCHINHRERNCTS